MACPRRSPCAFRCWQFAQVIDPSAVNPHLRRTDGGLAQRSRMGGAAVTLVGTGAAGPHLSLDGVPTTVGQHLLLPAGTDAGQHSTNRAPELIKWVGPAVPSERRTVATARAASRNTAKSSLDSHQNRGTCTSLRDGILCPLARRGHRLRRPAGRSQREGGVPAVPHGVCLVRGCGVRGEVSVARPLPCVPYPSECRIRGG